MFLCGSDWKEVAAAAGSKDSEAKAILRLVLADQPWNCGGSSGLSLR